MSQRVNATNTYLNPVELLQKLIQYDTTNPPGNESGGIAMMLTAFLRAKAENLKLPGDVI